VTTYKSEDQFKSGLTKTLANISGQKMWEGFARPFDVTGDNRGHIFVSDAIQGVLLIDENANDFKLLECKDCKFPISSPRGVACDSGKVYIGLPAIGQIAVLSHEGKFLDTIGRRGSLPNPIDVVLDTLRHRVLVVDNKIAQVRVFSEHGDSLFSIGRPGDGDGEFNRPQSVAVDKDGNIYVVDAFNFRIQIFDSTGKYVRKFGQQGDTWGMFAMPKGIALDADTNIYILDGQHNHFQVFNNHGELLLFVGKYSSGNDGFVNPVSIFIDNRNRVYVTDQLNARVQVFQILNTK
jgi:DNA-binding beta-propeller fold protein YncE